ncbi:MAG TPA: hypothetical protein VGO47_06550, partial [Chlamydiales bacterium]|nr:hypothetical protein [Chlamydiales bacterium]
MLRLTVYLLNHLQYRPGLEIRTSTDRIAFSLVGTVWAPNQANWTNQFTGMSNGGIWAPDCQYINGQFFVRT